MQKIYPYRFHIFLATQLLLLFGTLIFPFSFYESLIAPIIHIANICAGLILLHKKRKSFWLVGLLLLLATFSFFVDVIDAEQIQFINTLKLIAYFTFHVIVSIELILQVWKTKDINEKTILGLVSGFISLGFIGFFMFLTIELLEPGSFSFAQNGISSIQNLMYFSYITLLTIGYGEILPTTILAQKTVVFIGLIGQLYLVILTGIILGKYISKKE